MHTLIVLAAKYLFILPIILCGLAAWKFVKPDQRPQFGSFLIVSAILGLLFDKIAGHVWYDPRPFVVGHFQPLIAHTSDNGFPSDHTALTMLLAFVVLPYHRRLGYLMIAIAAIVGLARVAAGVHHLADIIGSTVIVGLAAILAWQLTNRFILPWLTPKLLSFQTKAR